MLYIIVFFMLCHTFGVSFGYLNSFYDEYRLLYLVIAVISIFPIICSKVSFHKTTIVIFSIIFLYLIISLINFNIFEIQDIVMWLSLFLIFIALLEINYQKYRNLLAFLVLLSTLPCIFILFSVFNLMVTGVWYDWQSTPGNIRIFDSYILFVFWLNLFLAKNNNFIIIKVYLVVTFFIGLALLFSGARSALLSVFIPLIILWLMYKDYRPFINKNFIAFGFALFLYQMTSIAQHLISDAILDTNLVRISTSNRYEMWVFMFEQWKENPLAGVGGGFLSKIQYMYGHHTHNFFIRLISEWGVIGGIVVGFLFYQFYILLKSNVEPILKMGALAIFIDASFSGNLIYPVTQISCVLFLALVFSKIERNNENTFFSSKIIILLYCFLFLYLVFNFFWVDFLCNGCSSMDGRSAPFFWEYGGSKHLE